MTAGQTEVTGDLNTQTVGLQVLLAEGAAPGSADVALDHSLSENKE